MNREPIVIVGAGPTGSLLGIELARRGADVRILEKAPAPPRESRAGGVQSRTLELFARLGIVDDLLAAGNRVRAINYYSNTKPIFRLDFAYLDGPFPFMLHVPQYETQRVLDTHLERLGVSVERGVEVTGLAHDHAGVSVETCSARGEMQHVRTPYVAGCDGAHSAVRHQIGMPFEGQAYDWDWVGADVEVDWGYSESENHLFISDEGVLACLPYGGGRWRFITPRVQGIIGARPALDDMRELVARRGPVGTIIDNPSWLGSFRASRRSSPHFRQGRVFLAGDAVHIHSPAAGQGMNTGLGDAANLGWKMGLVATGRAPESLLDTYEPERAPVAHGVIALTHTIMKVFDSTTPGRPLRDATLPLLARSGIVQRTYARRVSQHSISYRTGPLTVRVGGRKPGVAAGERAPDVDGLFVGGKPTSLFGLLRGTGHTVFVHDTFGPEALQRLTAELAAFAFGVKIFRVAEQEGSPEDAAGAAPTEGDRRVLDARGGIRKRYGLGGGSILAIRPDGYLGYLGKPDGLPVYLSQCLLPERPAALWQSGFAEIGAE